MLVVQPVRELVLASGSPRRRQLLAALGVPFVVEPVEVVEDRLPSESPEDMVVRLSVAKARLAAARHANGIIVGSDTSVSRGCGQAAEMMGKPRDERHLRAMLDRLLGAAHTVHTGYAVLDARGGQFACGFQAVEVRLRPLTAGELEDYLGSGIGDDKAGGYAVQDRQYRLVESLEGCAAAAMGLPLCVLLRVLPRFGVVVPGADAVGARCEELTGVECCMSEARECPNWVANA